MSDKKEVIKVLEITKEEQKSIIEFITEIFKKNQLVMITKIMTTSLDTAFKKNVVLYDSKNKPEELLLKFKDIQKESISHLNDSNLGQTSYNGLTITESKHKQSIEYNVYSTDYELSIYIEGISIY